MCVWCAWAGICRHFLTGDMGFLGLRTAISSCKGLGSEIGQMQLAGRGGMILLLRFGGWFWVLFSGSNSRGFKDSDAGALPSFVRLACWFIGSQGASGVPTRRTGSRTLLAGNAEIHMSLHLRDWAGLQRKPQEGQDQQTSCLPPKVSGNANQQEAAELRQSENESAVGSCEIHSFSCFSNWAVDSVVNIPIPTKID